MDTNAETSGYYSDLSRRVAEARAELSSLDISESEHPHLIPYINPAWQALRLRRGRFTLAVRFIEDHPELTLRLMSRCIVVRAEMMYATMEIEYEALSPSFDLCEPLAAIPRYMVIVQDDSDIWFEHAEKER